MLVYVKTLPLGADIILKAHGCVVIEVCGAIECESCLLPRTNIEFWLRKPQGCRERYKRKMRPVGDTGLRDPVLWECELNDIGKLRQQPRESLEGQPS